MKKTFTRKILSIILAVTVSFGALPMLSLPTFAASSKDLSFELNETGDGYVLTECNMEASGAVTIPSTYKGLPVTEIGAYSFAFCYYVTSVKIPDSVTVIGEAAFLSCGRIYSLTIPSTVTSIGAYAFGYFYNPDTDYFIGYGSKYSISGYTYSVAHDYCVLYNVEFKSLGKVSYVTYALNDEGTGYILTHFSLAYDTDSFDIPHKYNGLPITEIGDAAFANCSSIVIMTMPDTVVRIGNAAFAGCSKLWWEHFSENVESIGYRAFYDTPAYNKYSWNNGVLYYENFLVDVNLDEVSSKVNIKDGTTVICDLAFMGCEAVEQVRIPGSVKNIGLGAFTLCTSLENAEIEGGVEKIGDGAFYACDALKSITVPETVTEIGEYALGWTYDEDSAALDDILLKGFEIFGFEGSVAEKYAEENRIKFVAITKATDENTGITVEGKLPENTQFTVKELEVLDNSVIFDIAFSSNGALVQPEGKVNVKIPIPEGFDSAKCNVYRKEADGTYTDMKDVCKGSYLVFTTDRFGEYIVTTEKLVIICGDVNGDDELTPSDVVLLRRYFANYDSDTNTSSVEIFPGADANGDGVLTPSDVVLLRRYFANYNSETGESTIVLGASA